MYCTLRLIMMYPTSLIIRWLELMLWSYFTLIIFILKAQRFQFDSFISYRVFDSENIRGTNSSECKNNKLILKESWWMSEIWWCSQDVCVRPVSEVVSCRIPCCVRCVDVRVGIPVMAVCPYSAVRLNTSSWWNTSVRYESLRCTEKDVCCQPLSRNL